MKMNLVGLMSAFKHNFKEILTLVLFIGTLVWSIYAVEVTADTIARFVADPTASGMVGGIIKAAGCDVLLGALITWNAIVFQFWFRKKGPPEEGK